MKKIITIVAGVVSAPLLGALNVIWLIWFLATVASVAILRWAALPEKARKVVGSLVLLVLILMMGVVGTEPTHFDQRSATQSRLPIVGPYISSPPAEYARASLQPPLDDLGQTQETFRREVFRLRAQSNAVELALSLKVTADGAIDYGQNAKIQINDLLDHKAALLRALENRKLDSLKRLDETKAALDEFLQQSEDAMARETTAAGARRALTAFRLAAPQKSIDDVNDHVLRLEQALDRIGKDIIGNELSQGQRNRIRLDEPSRTIVRDELVSFSIGKFAVKEIDASEWMLSHDPEAISQEQLLVYFGDNEAEAKQPDDIHHIPIRPGINKVGLIKRTVVPSGLTELPSLRFVSFRYFLWKWPNSFPAKLRLLVDLSSVKLSEAYPYSIETNRNAPITELRLPVDSLFNTIFAFTAPRREGVEDVFAPPDSEALTPSYFLTHNFIWVELMPDSFLFRNKLIQEWKPYLFYENLVAAIAVMSFGALLAALFG